MRCFALPRPRCSGATATELMPEDGTTLPPNHWPKKSSASPPTMVPSRRTTRRFSRPRWLSQRSSQPAG